MAFNSNLTEAVSGRVRHDIPNPNTPPAERSDLDSCVLSFYEFDKDAKYFSKQATELKTRIKEIMEKDGLTEHIVNDIKISLSTATSCGYDSEKLLEILKEVLPEDLQKLVIKTQEYVDLTVLSEDILYHRKMDAALLKPAMTTSETVRLNVKKIKGGKSA
jgi:hypothetical protein